MYENRVKEQSNEKTVAELKTICTKIGYKGKFTYMKKRELIELLIDLKKKDFIDISNSKCVKSEEKSEEVDLSRNSGVSDKNEVAVNEEVMINTKKRRYHEREEAEEIDSYRKSLLMQSNKSAKRQPPLFQLNDDLSRFEFSE